MIRHPGKLKKKRFDRLKALYRNKRLLLRFLASIEYDGIYDIYEDDEYEAPDDEFEDSEEELATDFFDFMS